MVNLGIKAAVKEWMAKKWKDWVKDPIANRTEQMENQVSQKVGEYSGQAKAAAYKPKEYYDNQPAFYRGLFWIAMGCLIVLWIISGS